MIRIIKQDEIIINYPEQDEKEILINYLIKEYNLNDIDMRIMFDNEYGCCIVERVISTNTQPIGKIIECIRVIDGYKIYKTTLIGLYLLDYLV